MVLLVTLFIENENEWSVDAVVREQGGGLAGAEPLQLFGWGDRNIFEPPTRGIVVC